jgi:hypothetical protein
MDSVNKKGYIMKYANEYGYSDIEPWEVVRVISDKTIEIREMQTERDESVKLEFNVGGFSAHCSNQNAQKWIITSKDDNPVIRIRKSKTGYWKCKNGSKFKLSDTPYKYYDYNF